MSDDTDSCGNMKPLNPAFLSFCIDQLNPMDQRDQLVKCMLLGAQNGATILFDRTLVCVKVPTSPYAYNEVQRVINGDPVGAILSCFSGLGFDIRW